MRGELGEVRIAFRKKGKKPEIRATFADLFPYQGPHFLPKRAHGVDDVPLYKGSRGIARGIEFKVIRDAARHHIGLQLFLFGDFGEEFPYLQVRKGKQFKPCRLPAVQRALLVFGKAFHHRNDGTAKDDSDAAVIPFPTVYVFLQDGIQVIQVLAKPLVFIQNEE